MNARRRFLSGLSFSGLAAFFGFGAKAVASSVLEAVPAPGSGGLGGDGIRVIGMPGYEDRGPNRGGDGFYPHQREHEQHYRDVNYLLNFMVRARQVNPDMYRFPFAAKSLPFAAIPTTSDRIMTSLYIRWPEGRHCTDNDGNRCALADDRELQHLVDDLYAGRGDRVQKLISAMYEKLCPPVIERVPRLHKQADGRFGVSRVVSPRLIIDIDELTAAQLAHTIIQLAADNIAETVRKMTEVAEKYPHYVRQFMYSTPLKAHVKIDAYMLELFAYNEQTGRMIDPANKDEPLNIPIGSLPTQLIN